SAGSSNGWRQARKRHSRTWRRSVGGSCGCCRVNEPSRGPVRRPRPLVARSPVSVNAPRADPSKRPRREDGAGRIASELAVGAQALLTLATALQATPTDRAAHGPAARGDGHQFHRGERLPAISRINRSGLEVGTPAPSFRLPYLDG